MHSPKRRRLSQEEEEDDRVTDPSTLHEELKRMFEKMSEHMFKFGQETYDSYEDLFSKSLSSDIVMLPFFWEVFLERFVKDLKESDNIESVVTWITYSLSDSIHTHPVNDKFFASFISKWVSKRPVTPLNEIHIRNACAAIFFVFCLYSNKKLQEFEASLDIVEKLTKVLNYEHWNSKPIQNNTCIFALLTILQIQPSCDIPDLMTIYRNLKSSNWPASHKRNAQMNRRSELRHINVINLFLACCTHSQLDHLCVNERIPDAKRETILRRLRGRCDAVRPTAADGWLCGTNWMWTNFYFPVPSTSDLKRSETSYCAKYWIKFEVRMFTSGSNRIGIGPYDENENKSEGGYDMIANEKSICFDSYHQEIKIFENENERIKPQQIITKLGGSTIECILSYNPSKQNHRPYEIQFNLNHQFAHSFRTAKPFDNQCVFISLGTGQRARILSDWNLQWSQS